MSLKEFILNYHGCPIPPKSYGCYGPTEQWWLFGLSLNDYQSMIIKSFVIAVMFSLIFYAIKKENVNFKNIIKISVITFIISFVLIYLFRFWMQSNIVS